MQKFQVTGIGRENPKAFGADKILDVNSYNLDEVIGLGLSDESFFKTSGW